MSLPLLITKFYIPPQREQGVSRPRLMEKLLSGVSHPGMIILVSGPAGFGKTTLLSEFAARLQQPIAWVSLDEGDNDPLRFWTYLITACHQVYEEVNESVLALFQTPQPLPVEAVPATLINDFARLDGDLTLVLDDYHVLQNEAIHTAFLYLLEHIPPKLHLVVATRVDPPWPLARFRARNQLVEMRAQDLRFTMEEAASFLNRLMGLSLSMEEVASLEERTEGWVAGLQLAALSMKGHRDITGFIKAFTGSHVYIADYLVEEVLKHQPEERQAFLLKTSTLERLNSGLCEAVTGCQDSQAFLVGLQRENLFVTPLDNEGRWYRYHPLFADLLQARLRQSHPEEAIAALHHRAATWYEQAGMTQEAIKHALKAEDYAHVTRLVEKAALPMILQAYVRTVENWLQTLPPAYLEQSPRLNLAFAWINLLRGTFSQATPYIERLVTIFSSARLEPQDPSLLGEWLAVQSRLLGLQRKATESRDLANQALQMLPEADIYVRSMLYANLAMAYQQMLEYDQAAEAFQMMVRNAQITGDFATETLGTSGQGQMILMQGKLYSGFAIASEGIKRLEAAGRITPFSATLYGELGQIYYHWHQLDQSRQYLERSVQASGQSGFSDPEIYHYVILSRIAQMEGNWEAAAQEVEKATDLMQKIPPAMVREELISQQVRVCLAGERLADALALLKPEGFGFDEMFTYPELAEGANVTHITGLMYNSALRVLLFKARVKNELKDLRSGIELAGRLLAGELQCRHIPIAVETLLIRSQLYSELSEGQKSLAEVDKAVELAEPEGFISLFVEEGAPAVEALRILLKSKPAGTTQAKYIQEILNCFPRTQPIRAIQGKQAPVIRTSTEANIEDDSLAPVEPLTNRELEVLRLIAAGEPNQRIADKLVITLSAVKKHTGNIFNKLNVSSRTQAVARARQAGLL